MYIKVEVVADAKEETLTIIGEDSFRVSVRAPRKRGLANRAMIGLLRKHFDKAGEIRIVSGHQQERKIVSID